MRKIDRESIKQELIEQIEIVNEIKADPTLLEEIRNRILRKRLHKQLIELVQDAVNSNQIKGCSLEDLYRVMELDVHNHFTKTLVNLVEKMIEGQTELPPDTPHDNSKGAVS